MKNVAPERIAAYKVGTATPLAKPLTIGNLGVGFSKIHGASSTRGKGAWGLVGLIDLIS